MGLRGRVPKPTIVQLLAGDPGKRAKTRAKREMKPPSGVPSCPRSLKGYAREHWKYLTKLLGRMEYQGQRLLSPVHLGPLVGMCEAYKDAMTATRLLDEHGGNLGGVYPIKKLDKDGVAHVTYMQQMPWVSMKAEAWQRYYKFAQQFGLTPGSQTNVSRDTVAEESEHDKFFRTGSM